MKLDEVRFKTDNSNSPVEEKFFSIEDQAMVFDILRNKMYSDPIAAICREISCNARDAHREVGKSDTPIVIHIPNNNEPYFKVKDFGPGISPDRINNIFIKYTASTKRSDNVQTGGFGLGAKTPFSYSDTFTIITNYDGVKYNYLCFIDDTKVGKMTLLSESPTDEINGTEIIVPVKSENFTDFIRCTQNAVNYWDVKPIIKGGAISYYQDEVYFSGDNWKVVSYLKSNYNRYVNAIIDGISYPLDVNTISNYASTNLINSVRGNLLLYFNTGDLSLSASREQVYLDAPTKDKISLAIENATHGVRDAILSKIDTIDNLWLAKSYYKNHVSNILSTHSFMGVVSWKGIDLDSLGSNLPVPVYNFFKSNRYTNRWSGALSKTIIRRRLTKSISFAPKSLLIINDLNIDEPSSKHVKNIFEKYPEISDIDLICSNQNFEVYNAKYHFDKMKPLLLSSFIKQPKVINKNYNKLVFYKFDDKTLEFRKASFSNVEDDSKTKVFLTLEKSYYKSNKMMPISKDISGNLIDLDYLRCLSKTFENVSFYGISKEISISKIENAKSSIKNIVPLNDLIKDYLSKCDFNALVKAKYINSLYLSDSFKSSYEYYIKNIKDKNSPYLKKILLLKEVFNISYSNEIISLMLYEKVNGLIEEEKIDKWFLNNQNYNFKTINEECYSRYPLLSMVEKTHGYENHICNYINLIDKEMEV